MFFKPKTPTEVALAQLDKEMKKIEKRLPWWKWLMRYFFTGRAWLANNLGEAKGYLVSIVVFWSTPAKVWAGPLAEKLASFGEALKSVWEATLVVLHLSSNT